MVWDLLQGHASAVAHGGETVSSVRGAGLPDHIVAQASYDVTARPDLFRVDVLNVPPAGASSEARSAAWASLAANP